MLGGREPVLAAPQHEHRHLELPRCARAARRCSPAISDAAGRRSGARARAGRRAGARSGRSPRPSRACRARAAPRGSRAAPPSPPGRATGFGSCSSAGQLTRRPEIACHHHGALSPRPAGATSTSRSTSDGSSSATRERHRAAERMADERGAARSRAPRTARGRTRGSSRSGRPRSTSGGSPERPNGGTSIAITRRLARERRHHPAPASAVSP